MADIQKKKATQNLYASNAYRSIDYAFIDYYGNPFGSTLRCGRHITTQGSRMTYRTVATHLVAFVLLGVAMPTLAQETGGFKGFLKRTAGAVLGQPTAGPGLPNGTVSAGTTTTDGPVYRPIQPGAGTFAGVFKGYAGAANVEHYPRVALTFLTYGAAEACWRTRATIWTSASAHTEETFDLCNGALMMKDDLGRTTQQSDPTLPLTSVIDARQYMATNRFVTVVDERTTGPNPARIPFHLNIAQADGGAFMRQYRAIIARAMVVSGYNAGDQGQLMWVGGFDPAGNRDQHVD